MSLTYPLGFKAAGLSAGLKASGALDLAVIQNCGPSTQRRAAARFTTNRFAAAPVVLAQHTLAQANQPAPSLVVLNSGGANACTGQGGMEDAVATAEHAAQLVNLTANQVLVCSTGLIGQRLDLAKLLDGLKVGIGQLAPSPSAALAAATAILTTDTKPKQAQQTLGGWRIGGMAKGSGMLAPELATMLVVLTTDALIDQETADLALAQACQYSFDRIDSDGCQSTNDAVILLASGESGVCAERAAFTKALSAVCLDLAEQLIGDAEGASHDITITVNGATTEAAALAVARAIARSNLFKTAIAGFDPNWGRILSAAGTVPASLAPFDPSQVNVSINGVMVCQGGGAHQPRDLVNLQDRAVTVVVDLQAGQASASLLTNDLTHQYVHINADYSS